MSTPEASQSLRLEAARLHLRYCIEVIERFALCPWARGARLEGRTRTWVVTDDRVSPSEVAAELLAWRSDPNVDVIFIVAPTFIGDFGALGAWGTEVARSLGDLFYAAAFHPEPGPGAGIVHRLRRAPDPTVQLIRCAPLDALRAEDPPHYRDVFSLDLSDLEGQSPAKSAAATVVERNDRVFSERCGKAIRRAADAIRSDRDSTYARLGVFEPIQRPNFRCR